MKRTPLAVALLLVAPVAQADQMGGASHGGYAVLTTATQVFTPSSSNTWARSVLVVNLGADTIYCSPQSTVTTNTGVPISTGQSQAFPAVPLFCITTVDQTLSGTSRTLVWESAS